MEAQGIYRREVYDIMFDLADLKIDVKQILGYLEEEDDGQEEEEEDL